MKPDTTLKPLSKLFHYGTDVDEKFIKNKMYKWMTDDEDHRGFYKMLWNTLFELNKPTSTIKYLHFSERKQRLYLHDKFEKWAKQLSDEMADMIDKMERLKN